MKKLLLGLGTLAAIVAPITTVVACGVEQDYNGRGTQGPSNLDTRSWNHDAIETLADDEQTTGNDFVSTGVTQQNDVVTENESLTTEITERDGLSEETTAYRDAIIAAANSITKAQIEGQLASAIADPTKLPSQVTDLPSSVNVIPTTDSTTTVKVALVWTINDVDGSLKWKASIYNRTDGVILTSTITGFKKTADVEIEKEKNEANANSITKAQVEAELTTMVPDSTKLPSQVTDLPSSVNVIPTTDSTKTVEVSLAWFANDVAGSLTWTASIYNRTNDIILTSTITGFKDAITAKKENANSITRAQIEAELTTIIPDPTKLPSQVMGLPNSVNVIPTTDSTTTVKVALVWTINDVDGSLVWTATIDGRTNTDALTTTITGFKISDDSSAEDARDNANSITKAQVEAELTTMVPDSTKLPSQVTDLPSSVNVILTTSVDNVILTTNVKAIVAVNLMWVTNDYDGSLKWIASIDNRTNDIMLTSTITGFKDVATAKANANSVTEAQIEAVISVNHDSTKFPTEVRNLPQSLQVTTSDNANVDVTLTWVPNDIDGSLSWVAAINYRTDTNILTGTISGFKDVATEIKEVDIAAANSITEAEIKALFYLSSNPTKLPSKVKYLPQSLQIIASNNTNVDVTLTWTPNDVDGSLSWVAEINNRTKGPITGTILGFKDASIAKKENANSITEAQIEALIHINPDLTEFPSQVRNLPQSLQVTTSDNANVDVTLTWTPNDVDGSLTWTASIDGRTNTNILTTTIFGFKDEVMVETEKANSITKSQIDGQLTSVIADSTKLPSQVRNLPQSLQVTTSDNANVDVTLTWTPNDVAGSLTWTAAISNRTEVALTGTISNFKNRADADRDEIISIANSVSEAQIEAIISVNPDPTKLPSQVTNLPQSFLVAASNNTNVFVILTWTPNDIDGSLTWTAEISDRTKVSPTKTLLGFKDKVTADRDAIKEIDIATANSITKSQIDGQLTSVIADSTKLPSQVRNLPQSLQVTTSDNANVDVTLTWTPNDIDGSLTWTATINNRTKAPLTRTVYNFKNKATADRDEIISIANSITEAQIESLIHINTDSTEFPSQVANLPQSLQVTTSDGTNVDVTLIWTPNDINGSLSWIAAINNRTEVIPTGTISGFKDVATAIKEIDAATANSITQAQIEALIHITDSTKLPSQVVNLPQSLEVIASNNTNVDVTLTWIPNDVDGSLTWTATISSRTKTPITGTISSFKNKATADRDEIISIANSITEAQIEALIHVSSDSTKLPSQVANLPQSLQVTTSDNANVDVTLTWTSNDVDGSLTWTAAISSRTKTPITGTISGFKDKATIDREAIIAAREVIVATANSITQAQIDALIHVSSDLTKLPSEVTNLPQLLQVTTSDGTNVDVTLIWTPNDVDGTLTWTAAISDRTSGQLNGTISFKSIATANSITKAQIKDLIHVSSDSTKLPSEVTNLPQSLQVTASDGTNIDVTLTWTPNDVDGTLTWTATISSRTKASITGTIYYFKNTTTADRGLIIAISNLITKAQIEDLIVGNYDPTKLPSQVTNLPQSLQIATNNNINVDATLTWTANDIDGSLTWTALIGNRTKSAPTGTILGFKKDSVTNK